MRRATDLFRSAAPILLGCSLSCGGGGSPMGAGGGAGGAAGAGLGGGGAGPSDAGPTDAVPGSTTAQFTVVYGGTLTRTLTTCLDCTAFYDTATNYGSIGYDMQNAAGVGYSTTVYITVTTGFAAAWSVGIHFLENDPTLPQMYQGPYYFPGSLLEMQITPDACITLTAISLGPGGGVAGSFDCPFTGIAVGNQQPAQMRGTFSAVFQ